MTKEEAIEKVETSFPSIFTREDVITLINEIEPNINKVEFEKEVLMSKLRAAVDDAVHNLSNDEIVDISSCDFSINNGNEIQIDSIGIEHSTIIDEIMRNIEGEVEEFIDNLETMVRA